MLAVLVDRSLAEPEGASQPHKAAWVMVQHVLQLGCRMAGPFWHEHELAQALPRDH